MTNETIMPGIGLRRQPKLSEHIPKANNSYQELNKQVNFPYAFQVDPQ